MKDFIEHHYGDVVAIVMILAGGMILASSADQTCRAFGERLTGAGLMALKLTSKVPLNEGGGSETKPGDVP